MSVDTADIAAEFTEGPDIAGPSPIDIDAAAPAQERPRGFQWGSRKDGSPRAKPGRPAKGTKPGSERASSPRTVKPPRPAAPPKAAAPKPSQARKRVNYTEPLGVLLGLVLTPLQFVFPLDAMCIGARAEDIIKVGDNLANDVPRFGGWLDTIAKYTPYAEAMSLATVLGIQLAHNHGLVPEATVKMMGGIPRAQLAAQLAQQRQEQRAAAAEEKARFEAAMANMTEAA
jgi:hypothetical protein